MSNTVIKVENLSKRYVIGHQRQERYVTLRDAIANGANTLSANQLISSCLSVWVRVFISKLFSGR